MKIISTALLFAVMEFTHVDGREYNNLKLIQVKKFEKEEAEFCVRPLSENPKDVQLALLLEVKSAVKNIIFSAGNSSIADLTPNRWHKVTMHHVIQHNAHSLDVKVDDRSIPFKKPASPFFWSTSFHFKEITLFSKGRVQITDCSSAVEDTTAATTRKTTTTTTTTTTSAAATTTSAAATTTTTTTSRISTTIATIATIATKLSTKAMNTITEAISTITEAKTTVVLSQPTNDIEEDGAPWWDFIYCLGDFKGFPVLGMLLIVFILGVVIAAVCTIICKRCGCCSRKPERVGNSHRGNLGKDNIHPEYNLQDALLQPTSHQTSNNSFRSSPNRDYYHQERTPTPQDDFLPPPYYATRNDMHLENLHGENIWLESNPTSTLNPNASQYASFYTTLPDRTRGNFA